MNQMSQAWNIDGKVVAIATRVEGVAVLLEAVIGLQAFTPVGAYSDLIDNDVDSTACPVRVVFKTGEDKDVFSGPYLILCRTDQRFTPGGGPSARPIISSDLVITA